MNRPDVMQRKGVYPPPPEANPVLGLEVAGEVVAVAEGVHLPVGERVCALTNGGGYAEYCAVPAGQCLPWPPGYGRRPRGSPAGDDSSPSWANLFELGQLQPGQSALVHGGSSGIGTTAIQLARALGATVYVTAGSEAKCEACVKLGANAAINYKTRTLPTAIKQLTGAPESTSCWTWWADPMPSRTCDAWRRAAGWC
ncbi:MAG: zinc-binding dehydrogenase [Acetobacteraceae bacterium]